MLSLSRLSQLPPALLLLCSGPASFVTAKVPIDVELQATFPSPPFLVELLETAAAENQSAYFPLLETIASGRFHTAQSTEQETYNDFEKILTQDGHITDPAALASWRFSLATRESAPQIEAHSQFWRTNNGQSSGAFEVWRNGAQCLERDDCSATHATTASDQPHHSLRELHFDRINGKSPDVIPYTLYADLSSPDFPRKFKPWLESHREDPYRLRYKPAETAGRPLQVPGYGVELALKRTDYIVIDDRDADSASMDDSPKTAPEALQLEDETAADLKPLSKGELRRLSIKAAGFVMSSDSPFDTLMKVSQDFPKHSALLAQHNASTSFLAEHRANRKIFLRPGTAALWLNGQQIAAREADAFSLLDSTRRERKLVKSIQSQGLSAKQAVDLLQHPAIAEAEAGGDIQRYDYRDRLEAGRVVMWLNDVEKDKRYQDWPAENAAYLQRMFPGQLPQVRKNAMNIIVPLDLSDPKNVAELVEMCQGFIKRGIPVRFGFVPIATDPSMTAHVRVIYYLKEAYGLATMLQYLSEAGIAGGLDKPNKSAFESATETASLRKRHKAFSIDEVIADETIVRSSWQGAADYAKRLALDKPRAPFLVNGVPMKKTESWVQDMSQQISIDIQIIQQGVFEETIDDKESLVDFFLKTASTHRDPLLIPEDPKTVRLVDLSSMYNDFDTTLAASKPFLYSKTVKASRRSSLVIISDLNSDRGAQLVVDAVQFASEHEDVEVRFVHHSDSTDAIAPAGIKQIQDLITNARAESPSDFKEKVGTYLTGALASQTAPTGVETTGKRTLAASLDLAYGDSAIILNSRVLGPLPTNRSISKDDLSTLYSYEKKARLDAPIKALEAMKLESKLKGAFSLAKIASIIAHSAASDIPEGIFEQSGGPRTNQISQWSSDTTCIKTGNEQSASIHLTAVIDPASELAQTWIPTLHTLSTLEGVHLKLYLNPKDILEELPVKRFYRQVLQAAPEFGTDGERIGPAAHFTGIPENALLTMGMDLPPSWLVSPKESIHDLDNIKLGSMKSANHLYALYELENILIEGHSRDTTLGNPPRGAQVNLATGNDTEFASTIIMANLGYFQFKANPGVYELQLKDGASRSIFNLDSAGTLGYSATAGDEVTDIALYSFKGATIFPRLSRKPGQETKDVLDYQASSSLEDLAAQGATMLDGALAKAGLPSVKAGEYLAKGVQLGQNILSMSGMKPAAAPATKHADINIFSVASGHLYERMLNIMTVSVTRHTNATVKFWFIEQFLSPSFKTFLPTMAEAYGFQYEMVTFKWPHWLRQQTEKQRIIWGYKILFLDVLFPLDLDKVIFVDADQIVRTDLRELVGLDLEGAPYGFTPMCDSRVEMEGFRFWKTGYWKNFLRGLPYHISALYVVDLKRFRAIAAGDRLRQQYHALSADPNSLSNLDQDLPNHMQAQLPIFSLPQEWLWCETWCSDESLKDARTIDLCNNPQTKEPKLDRARRQVPEWTVYDDEIAALAKRARGKGDAAVEGVIGGPEGVKGPSAQKSGQVVQNENKEEL